MLKNPYVPTEKRPKCNSSFPSQGTVPSFFLSYAILTAPECKNDVSVDCDLLTSADLKFCDGIDPSVVAPKINI